jgi:S-adenosylmethionine hydrolase
VRKSRRFTVESLENRCMLSISDSVLAGPLIVGDTFSYDEISNGTTFAGYTDTVKGAATFNGHSATDISTPGSTNGFFSPDDRYEALDPTNGFVIYGEVSTDSSGGSTDTTTDTYSPFERIAPPTLDAGTVYSSSWTDTTTDVTNPGGSTGTSTTIFALTVELVSETEHTITVPAGTIKTYELDVTEAQTEDGSTFTNKEQIWVSPNIGIVKEKVGGIDLELAAMTGGPVTKLAFVQQPMSTVAGNTISTVKVEAENAAGTLVSDNSNVTLSIGSGPASAKIGGTLSEPLSNGVATFSNLSLTDARTFKLKAEDEIAPSVESTSFTISPAAPADMVFHVQPVSTVAGVMTISTTVELKDKFGNVATNDSTSMVILSIGSGPSSALLSGTLTGKASAGFVTFSGLSLTHASNYKLKASSTGLLASESKSFTILPTTPSALVFHLQPVNTVAGVAAISGAVEVKDKFGNVVTNDSSTLVTLSLGSGPSTAKLSGNLSAQASDGIAAFSGLSLTDATTYKLEATSTGLTSTESKSFAILPAPAKELTFLSTQATTDTVNGIVTPAIVVRLKDQFGNVVNTNTSQIKLSIFSEPTGGSLTGVLMENAVAGVATFSDVKLGAAGKYVLLATDTGLPSVKSKTIVVS